MSLLFLFHRNAELCLQMAAAAKSAEIRQEWTVLAKQWQHKAESHKAVSASEPTHQSVRSSPSLVPTQPSDDFEGELAKMLANLALEKIK